MYRKFTSRLGSAAICLVLAACANAPGPRGEVVPTKEQVVRLSQAAFTPTDRYAVGISVPSGSITGANWMLLARLAPPLAGALSDTAGVDAEAMSHFPDGDWWGEWDHAEEGGHNFDHFFRDRGFDGYLHVTIEDNGGRFSRIETDLDFHLIRLPNVGNPTTVFYESMSPQCGTVDAGKGLEYTDSQGCAEDIAEEFRRALAARLKEATLAR